MTEKELQKVLTEYTKALEVGVYTHMHRLRLLQTKSRPDTKRWAELQEKIHSINDIYRIIEDWENCLKKAWEVEDDK